MKKLVVALTFILLLLSSKSLATNEYIFWNPVCRHNAIFWASVVQEQYPVRFYFVRVKDENDEEITQWHVQPQVKIKDSWYYFKVEKHHVVIMSKPSNWKEEYIMYPRDYIDWLFKIDRGETLKVYHE